MHLLPTFLGLLTSLPLIESSVLSVPRSLPPAEISVEERPYGFNQRNHGDGRRRGRPVLRPAVRLNINRRDYAHFEPTNTSSLFFADSRLAYEDALAASLTASTHDLAVSADDSEYIKSAICLPSGRMMKIKFDDLDSFKQAKKLWSSHEKITFISADDTCEPTEQFGFFRSTNIIYDEGDLLARPIGQIVNITEAVHNFDLGWGMFRHNQTHRKEYLRKRELNHAEVNIEKRTTPPPELSIERTVVPRAAAPAVSPIPAPGIYVADCKTYPVSPIAQGTTCQKRGTIPKFSILKPFYTVKNELTCATDCLANSKCMSYGFDPVKISCQLYSKTLAQQSWIYNPKGTITYSERVCWGCWICGTRPNTPLPAGITFTGPMIKCGDGFDKTLDGQIGAASKKSGYSVDGLLSQLYPGVDIKGNGYQISKLKRDEHLKRDANGNIDIIKRLEERGFFDWLGEVVKKIVTFVVDLVKAAVTLAKAILETVVGGITLLTGGTWSPTLGPFELDFNLGPDESSLEETPFGAPGLKILEWDASSGETEYANAQSSIQTMITNNADISIPEKDKSPGLTVYCVDCGIQGDMVFEGHASFSLSDGVKELGASMHGKIHAGLHLGVEAFYKKEWEGPKKQLAQAPLGGFYIPGVITIGPMATLSVDSKLEVEAIGLLFGGISVDFPDMRANVDFLDSSKSGSSGFVPEINYKLWARGELTATASVGLPISVGVGVDILSGKFEKQIALITRPYISAEATYKAQIGSSRRRRQAAPQIEGYNISTLRRRDEEECKGIGWEIGTGVEFNLDVAVDTYQLGEWKGPEIASGCFEIGGSKDPDNGDVKPTDTGTGSARRIGDGSNLGDINNLLNPAKTPKVAPGFEITVLSDPGQTVKLYAARDGNLLLGPFANLIPGTNFIGRKGVVVTDEQQRPLTYQPDVMAAYNVSRLRVASTSDVVYNAKGITLVPVTSNGQTTYAASDASGNVLLLAWCNAPQWQGSHIFLVKDYDKSMANLLKYTIQYYVTGAEVTNCEPLVMTSKSVGVASSSG